MQIVQELLHKLGQVFVWLVIVAPWEQALRIRLGRRVTMLTAGTYLVIPFIDRLYRQSVRRRLKIVCPQTLTTQDGIAITVSGVIGFAILDLRMLYDTLHDAADTVESEVAALVAAYVARHDLDDCQPPSIENHVREKMTLGKYGLGSQEFYITNFVAAKTYRVVTGEIRQWQHGGGLDTSSRDGAQKLD